MIPFIAFCMMNMAYTPLLNQIGEMQVMKVLTRWTVHIYLSQSIVNVFMDRVEIDMPKNIQYIIWTLIFSIIICEGIERPLRKAMQIKR